jgi:insulin receptor
MSRLASAMRKSIWVNKKNGRTSVDATNGDPKKKDWEFDRAHLEQQQQLGSGQFGVVFRGLAKGICPPAAETAVAIKVAFPMGLQPTCLTFHIAGVQLLSDTSAVSEEDFFKEADIMKTLDGPHNIVRLLGVCTRERPYLMIMELMENGDLKTVLRDARPEVWARLRFDCICKKIEERTRVF